MAPQGSLVQSARILEQRGKRMTAGPAYRDLCAPLIGTPTKRNFIVVLSGQPLGRGH